MATAVAGTVGAVAGSAVSSVVGQVSSYIRDALKKIYHKIITYIKEISRQVSQLLSRATSSLINSISVMTSATGKKITSVSTTVFRYFYRVLKDVVADPKGVFLAVAMYRLINLQVPCDPKPYEQLFDNIEKQIESLSIPSITVPRIEVPLEKFAEKVYDAITQAEEKLKGWEVALERIDTHAIYRDIVSRVEADQPCAQPPWYDVGGWFGYVFCVIRSGLLQFGALLARVALDVGVQMLKFFLTILRGLLFIVKHIVYFVLIAVDWVTEVVLNALLFLAGLIINALVSVANFLANFLVKLPAKAFIRYIARPVTMFIVGVFKWIKENMSRALCWYIRVAPWLVTGSAVVDSIKRGSILGALGSFLFMPIAVSTFTAVAVPECTSAKLEYDLHAPPEPVEFMPELPQLQPLYIDLSVGLDAVYTSRATTSIRHELVMLAVISSVASATASQPARADLSLVATLGSSSSSNVSAVERVSISSGATLGSSSNASVSSVERINVSSSVTLSASSSSEATAFQGVVVSLGVNIDTSSASSVNVVQGVVISSNVALGTSSSASAGVIQGVTILSGVDVGTSSSASVLTIEAINVAMGVTLDASSSAVAEPMPSLIISLGVTLDESSNALLETEALLLSSVDTDSSSTATVTVLQYQQA